LKSNTNWSKSFVRKIGHFLYFMLKKPWQVLSK
jgi:hypothetical protein